MRIEIGYKFVLGFMTVIALVVFTPYGIGYLGVEGWMKEPLAILVAITGGLILGTIISKGLTRGFRNLVTTANHIGLGDLTKGVERADRFFQDETTDLAESLNQMLDNLRELVGHVKMASDHIADASREIDPLITRINKSVGDVKEALERINRGAREQEEKIGKTEKVIGGIERLSTHTADSAMEAAKVATRSYRVIGEASERANTAIDRLEKVFYGIERARDAIARLEEELEAVPKVLDFITHISRQTDLLAINASIEASKAGEHGKGFSNVAQEVRRFADSTERSSRDIAQVIRSLREGIEVALEAFKEGVVAIREGRMEIREIQKALEMVMKGIEEVDRRMKHILQLSKRQKKGVTMAVAMVNDVSTIARENLTIVDGVEREMDHHFLIIKEVSSAFKRLEEMAGTLEEVVKRFKVEEGDGEGK